MRSAVARGGNMVKVMEPQSLQNELCKWLRRTIEAYSEAPSD